MDPLLAAAAFSATASMRSAGRGRLDEDAFYALHGGRLLRRAMPAAPSLLVALAVVVLAGILDGG